MLTFAATLLLASSISPTPAGDIDAFIRFMRASERCPGIVVNVEKTIEQIHDLGRILQWTPERTSDKILVDARIAQFEYQQDRAGFCVKTRDLFYSYDPAYLRKVGVVD